MNIKHSPTSNAVTEEKSVCHRNESDMKHYGILGGLLAALGGFGALVSSPIFFGLFTSGIFLIAYDLLTVKVESRGECQVSVAQASASPLPVAKAIPQFCPNGGVKLEGHDQRCSLCGKQLEEGA